MGVRFQSGGHETPEMLGVGADLQEGEAGGSSAAPPGSALTVNTTLRLLSSSMSCGTPVLAQRIT